MNKEFEEINQILLCDENNDNIALISTQMTYIFKNDFALVGKIENPKEVYHLSKIRNNEYLSEMHSNGKNIVYLFSVELMKYEIIEKDFVDQIATAISLNENEILISFWNHSDSVFKFELKMKKDKFDVHKREHISLSHFGMIVSFLVLIKFYHYF